MMKTVAFLAISCFLGVGSAACGDDEGGRSNNTPKQKPKPAARRAAPAKAAADPAAYPKVDEELRHQLTETDFIPDASGATNRDPFRSWVLKPILANSGEDDVKAIDVCTEGNVRWGAPSYSFRDLRLIGLVKRGRSAAQFTDDSETDSWIVRKGDCIGQEKAIIEEVGVGYVRLSIMPPVPPGAPAPPAQKQDISLHPDELETPDSVVSDFAEEKEEE